MELFTGGILANDMTIFVNVNFVYFWFNNQSAINQSASLQRPYSKQIMTPRQLFEYAVGHIKTVKFQYCTQEEWEAETEALMERFDQARTIQGTQKIHFFKPVSQIALETRIFSRSPDVKKVQVTLVEGELAVEDIRGFVAVVYGNQWWVACVLSTFPETSQVKVQFLEPAGPSKTRSYSYPSVPDILSVPAEDVLTLVDPMTTTGRTYRLTEKETQKANLCMMRRS